MTAPFDPSAPRCLITGCDLKLDGSSKHFHGDLFELGDCYIFNSTGEPIAYKVLPTARLLTVIDTAHYFERRGVFVIRKSASRLNKVAKDYIS